LNDDNVLKEAMDKYKTYLTEYYTETYRFMETTPKKEFIDFDIPSIIAGDNHITINLNLLFSTLRGVKISQEILDDSKFIDFFYKLIWEPWQRFCVLTYNVWDYAPKLVDLVNNITRPGYMMYKCENIKMPPYDPQIDPVSDPRYACGRAMLPVHGESFKGRSRLILFNTYGPLDNDMNENMYNQIKESLLNNDQNQNPNPISVGGSANHHYKIKYFKYKAKYMRLKNGMLQHGGDVCVTAKSRTPVIPTPVKKDITYVDTDQQIIKALNDISKYDVFILKIGTNELHEQGKQPIVESTLFDSLRSNFAYETDAGIIELKNKTPANMKILMRLMNNFMAESKALLSIDPENESNWPFNLDIQPNPSIFLRSKFPLARGSPDANEIINKVVDYPGLLILVNSMASHCYNSMKEILDKRRAQGKKTEYLLYVNAPLNASCELKNPLYTSDDALMKCDPELI